MKRVLPLVLAVAVIASAPACRKTEVSAATAAKAAPTSASAVAPAVVALPVLGPAMAWTLKDPDGREVSLADLKGKVVVVDFWATWCVPCRQEIPDYVKLQEKLGKDGLVIVGLSLDSTADAAAKVKKFGQEFKTNYPLLMADMDLAGAYGVSVIPTTFVIDREGQVRHRKDGLADMAAFEKVIAQLLK